MKQVILFLFSLFCLTTFLYAQATEGVQKQGVTDAGNEKVDESALYNTQSRENESEADMWSDPLYYQFEKMMPELAKSVGRLDNRISTLAVTDLKFSHNLEKSFRKVAAAKLYGQMLIENPKLKLIKCNECNMLRSEISNGILTVSRGLATQEDRKKLSKKLGVQGFMTAMIIEDERQLTIVLNVYDAQEGRVILSDVITGVPAPETNYYNYYLGQVTLPVMQLNNETVTHSAILLGMEKTYRFSESWMLSANVGLYSDNNSKLDEGVTTKSSSADGHITISPGLMFDGSVGWEVFSFMNNNASLSIIAGIGEFLQPQFNFAVYSKAGLKMVIGQFLTFNFYSMTLTNGQSNLSVPEDYKEDSGETVKKSPYLTGSAQSVAFGFQF